jgi:hypothetical protein
MSATDRTRIGFDRTIHSEWLDAVVARVLIGETVEETTRFLWKFLEDIELGSTISSGRGKTLTVLNRVWVSVPKGAKPLKHAALKAVGGASGETRIAIHWAMVVGTHPFFLDVATHTGQLIKLNGQANRSQIKRRMTETWGDRSTVERAIQHVLRSMVQWGLLRSGEDKGSLVGPPHRINISDELGQLLVHSVLIGNGKTMQLSNLLNHPAIFPFSIRPMVRDLMGNPIFQVQRQGDQSDLVDLA